MVGMAWDLGHGGKGAGGPVAAPAGWNVGDDGCHKVLLYRIRTAVILGKWAHERVFLHE